MESNFGMLPERINGIEFAADTAARKAFKEHLKLVSHALRMMRDFDDNCVLSSRSEEEEAIRACIGDAAVLNQAIESAHAAHKALTAELERACRGNAALPKARIIGQD